MIAITSYAWLDRSIFLVGSQLTSDRWFQATLLDAYFGFLTFFVWVAYKEPGIWPKIVWFVLIMTLGNIAMSIYVLVQLARFDRSRGMESVLLARH
jgi:4-hydroxybenzoate polyprenyltransferase